MAISRSLSDIALRPDGLLSFSLLKDLENDFDKSNDANKELRVIELKTLLEKAKSSETIKKFK